MVGEPGRTNITVQWMVPDFRNGIITSYNVRYDIDTDTDIDMILLILVLGLLSAVQS